MPQIYIFFEHIIKFIGQKKQFRSVKNCKRFDLIGPIDL